MSALVAWGVPDTALPAPRFPHREWRRPCDTTEAGALLGASPVSEMTPTLAKYFARPRLRLTARGRLLRSLIVFGVLALIALACWVPATEADQLTVDHHTVVQPGQTLSHIAREQLPQLPLREAVVRLQ